VSITSETVTCGDCGLDVVYNQEGYWPWRGIDGNDMCHTQKTETGAEVRWPHRVSQQDAEAVFDAYEKRTGQKAKHR
jgi:hypothetical protein